ncbi:MAG: CoA pyrophosphatase [Cyclobacteriaceae bacterium]|nr:MAG: CoA pyrophosphatase [Cyclobacteriaceae bacterium]
MKIDYEALRNRLTLPLPGELAHNLMRAEPVGAIKPKFEHKLPPRPGSVMILLYPDGNDVLFPLTKRPDYLGTHVGQISLPGGKAETGETLIETALRETEEEIGIDSKSIEILGTLSDFFVIPSNFMVTPVVGMLHTQPIFKPDPKEVVKVLKGSVNQLLESEAIRTKEILAAKLFPMWAPHFEIEQEVVWGATAMILNEFRTILKELN